MSRYELSVLPQYDGKYSVAVGWDRPLSTFFVLVSPLDDDEHDENGLLVDLEHPTDPAVVLKAAKEYATVPSYLYVQLLQDAD